MTKADAICEIAREAYRGTTSVARYKKMLRCIKTLDLTIPEASRLLYILDYTREDGTTVEWLTKKLKERRP